MAFPATVCDPDFRAVCSACNYIQECIHKCVDDFPIKPSGRRTRMMECDQCVCANCAIQYQQIVRLKCRKWPGRVWCVYCDC